jgi:hypothetical protein
MFPRIFGTIFFDGGADARNDECLNPNDERMSKS